MARLVALVLLAAAIGYAEGGIVSTEFYTCNTSTCKPPLCMCPSNTPPGGLTPNQIPQFILISHDNALNNNSYSLVADLYGSKRQPNAPGCPVPITWFAMRYHSTCESGRAAMARGDELAMQANRFYPSDPFTDTDPNPNYDSRDPATGKPSVEIEITMSRKWWNEACGLPIRNMVGYRSQGYYNNQPIRQTLSSKGYLYDATLIERWYPNHPTSPDADHVLWPYTMDSGIPQECEYLGEPAAKVCSKNESYRGLWEVPLWQMQDGDKFYGVADYGNTEQGSAAVPDMFQLFKSQLDGRLAGGRSPLQISTFYEWLSTKPTSGPPSDPRCLYCYRPPSNNAKALAKFIDYALQQPDVYFVTYSDLIRWMQNPVPKDQFAAWWGSTCQLPGVKADLGAVNLTAAQLALGAPQLTPPSPQTPSPEVSPPAPQTPAPTPSPTVDAVPSPPVATKSPDPAPSTANPVVVPSPTLSSPPASPAASPAASPPGATPPPPAILAEVDGMTSGSASRAMTACAAGAAAALGALLTAL